MNVAAGNTNAIRLADTGLPMPDLSLLRQVREWLVQNDPEVEVRFFGSVLWRAVVLGDWRGAGDVDAAMGLEDFVKRLKPVSEYHEDMRDAFDVPRPHARYMMHLHLEGRLAQSLRPFVMRMRTDVQEQLGWPLPVGLVTCHPTVPTVMEMLADNDLGLVSMVSDGMEVWLSEAAVQDIQDRTLTMQRCRDARDYARTLRRLNRMLEMLPGWEVVVPEEFRQYAPPL